MRFIVIAMALAMVFLGCTTIPEPAEYTYENTIPEPSDVKDARNWVVRNIDYKEDTDENDSWQPPHVTMDRGEGDCEDMALLIAFIVFDKLGIKLILLSSMNHIWILWEDRLLDSVSYYSWIGATDDYTKVYTYDQALRKAGVE